MDGKFEQAVSKTSCAEVFGKCVEKCGNNQFARFDALLTSTVGLSNTPVGNSLTQLFDEFNTPLNMF
ncbi:MAG: hypothetical protein FJ215_00910 [Ignavibacteria bacterium]|nr:hypothetical protein [Ignavibacteria bacterium]